MINILYNGILIQEKTLIVPLPRQKVREGQAKVGVYYAAISIPVADD